VAEVDGEVAGYTQYSLTPDGILHSLAIRIDAKHKGKGLGQKLMDAKVDLARRAGARVHFYAIAADGEVALKKIVEKQGMHLCQKHEKTWVYVAAL
jgi:GNAT superfamily N-acetyltransferase